MKTGIKEYDSLPPKLGAADTEKLRYEWQRHKLAYEGLTEKLNLCVKYASLLDVNDKPVKKEGSLVRA